MKLKLWMLALCLMYSGCATLPDDGHTHSGGACDCFDDDWAIVREPVDPWDRAMPCEPRVGTRTCK